MDLLLDINVAVDICAKRPAYYQDADLALAKCRQEGGRLWLYAGSVQTLEYVTRDALKHTFKAAGQPITARQLHYHTRQVLKTFAEDKQWLAALAAEGAVFDSEDPEDEQLIRALDRFAPGTIKLLTRDRDLCDQYPERTITPAAYLAQPAPTRRLDFIDLAAQQQHLRPQLERNLHRVLHHGQYILGPEVRELEERLAAYTVARRYHELLATDTHGSTPITPNQENVRVYPCKSVASVHPCKSVAKPLPWPQPDRTSVFAQYTLRVPDRDALQARLQAAGIPTAVHGKGPCPPALRRRARPLLHRQGRWPSPQPSKKTGQNVGTRRNSSEFMSVYC